MPRNIGVKSHMTMTDRTIFITGASQGIGAAAARCFAARGANVVLMARSRARLKDLAAEIGPRALAIPCDVAQFAQVEDAVLAGVQAFGSCDVLINNAAILGPIAPLAKADPRDFARTLDINVTGAFNAIRAVLHLMVAGGAGTIINLSSGAAHNPMEGWSAYCASKAALAMLTRQVHLEYADRGIRAVGLSPGTVATQMQRDIKASGIGPVADLDWNDHVSPDLPAKALLWMCGPGADPYLGGDLRLRSPEVLEALEAL